MTDPKDRLMNVKDKIVGEVKEVVGKATGNEELELKGKVQSSVSDLKTKSEKAKEDLSEKINDILDDKKDKK